MKLSRRQTVKKRWRKLSGNQIDLMLLDVMMPGIDGFEVTRRVRQDGTQRLLPIILVTSLQEREDRVKGIEAGCDDFISKPVDKMELLARVRSLLKVKAYNDLMSNYQKELESEVARRTGELRLTLKVLHQKITERKRVEEELQFRNILLSTQQEASIDGILVVDEKARILSYNRRFVEMWSIPANLVEDRVDGPVLQFVRDQMADPRSLFLQRVQYLYDQRQETSRDELVLTDGRVFDRYSAPMFGSDERYYGRVWYFRDITERKRTEDGLRISEGRYRRAEAIGHVGNWEYNLQTTKFWGSDEAKRIYGFDPEAWISPLMKSRTVFLNGSGSIRHWSTSSKQTSRTIWNSRSTRKTLEAKDHLLRRRVEARRTRQPAACHGSHSGHHRAQAGGGGAAGIGGTSSCHSGKHFGPSVHYRR